jgi:hypothetical protein
MIRSRFARVSAATLGLLPAIAAAHPGHYHPPGEDDEFDQLRADWLHLHGWLELSLAAVALVSIAVMGLHKSRKVRLGAMFAFGSSLALIAAF